jgi:hypothetical protein
VIELAVGQRVEEVLARGFFEVPRFQRPYSWTLIEVGQLWADMFAERQREYFIGAFILYDKSPEGTATKTYAIVDGQQRLTTLTILLAAIRDAFADELNEPELATGIQQYIIRRDRRNVDRHVLTTEGGFPFFQSSIQSFPRQQPPPTSDPKPDEVLLNRAYTYFRQRLDAIGRSVQADPTIPREDKRKATVQRLEDLRDLILNLLVIFVVVDNEDDAYVIFETLNTRGKDLNLSDLVRNFLLKDLRGGTDAADMPRTRFNQVVARLQTSPVSLDAGEFIFHSWLSRESFVSSRKLFSEMKSRIRTPERKGQLLDEYEEDVEFYVKVRRPRLCDWSRELQEVKRSLEALAVFKVGQPTPLLMAALRAYHNKTLTIAELKQLASGLEAFHFQFTAIVGRSSSGGVSRRYASYARELNRVTRENCNKVVRELLLKLAQSAPTREEFIGAFIQLAFASWATDDRQLVRYVLERHHRHLAPDLGLDFSQLTIEHIASENPQNPAHGDLREVVPNIGNLMLVSRGLNEKLANKPFARKREVLRAVRDVYVDPYILAQSDWTPGCIRDRATKLAELSFDKIWRLPQVPRVDEEQILPGYDSV